MHMQDCLQSLTRQKKTKQCARKIAKLPQSVTSQQELMANKPNPTKCAGKIDFYISIRQQKLSVESHKMRWQLDYPPDLLFQTIFQIK
jgi:hypothetical protein